MNKQFRTAIAVNFSSGNARKNFVAEHLFIYLDVFGFRPPVPNTRDHKSSRREATVPFTVLIVSSKIGNISMIMSMIRDTLHTHDLVTTIDVNDLTSDGCG
jgi:hypothetical protein